MRIGQMASLLNCSVATLRFYERRGLLPAPYRSESNYRYYGTEALERGRFIRRCRSLDMTLAEIEQLLALRDQPDEDCGAVIEAHLGHVRERIAELESLKGDLEQIQGQCDQAAAGFDCASLQQLEAADGLDSGADNGHVAGVHGNLSDRSG